MNFLMLAKAFSGSADPPVGRKWYSSRSSQTKSLFVFAQLEYSAPSGKGPDGYCSGLSLYIGAALPFPFTSVLDRCGPWEGAMGEGASVFCGTP